MKRDSTSHHQSASHHAENEKLKREHELLSLALRSLTYPFYVIDADDYSILLDNSQPGLKPSKEGLKCYAAIHGVSRPCSEAGTSCPLEIVKETRKPTVVEHVHQDDDGQPRRVEVRGYPVLDDTGQVSSIIEYSLDITERRLAEDRQQFAIQVMSLINQSSLETDAIRAILHLVKEFTGFDAVGIRLREGDDFPYYETSGFPAVFVEKERYLCTTDEASEVLRDEDGQAVLECMCGNVLRGRIDPLKPFFTEGGSFWTNSTSDLLASTTEEERQGRTRNICNASGYESVALIPLRSGDEVIGLLQLNDKRGGMFSFEMIKFFEGIGASVGIALARNRAEEALRKAHDELEVRVEERTADLRKTARALQVLSECNQSLVHAGSETELLDKICDIIVGLGRYRLAWVGFAEDDEQKTVRPVSQAGFEEGYLEALDVTWDDVERGQGPTGTAIRTGQPTISKDIITDPKFAPWREEASKRGYASSIGLPLKVGGKVIGALNIYAAEPDAFDTDELALLNELAEDLSFGIVSQRTRIEHEHAEKALAESEAKYRQLVEGTDNLVAQVNTDGRITFVNSTSVKILGMTPEECVGRKWSELVIPEDRKKTMSAFREWVSSGVQNTTFESRVRDRKGKIFDMLWAIDCQRDERGQISLFNCIARDITDRKRAEEAIHYRLELEGLVANLSTSFINLKAEEVDSGFDRALREIGEFMDVDRSYIFQFADDTKLMDNTHEWCQKGVIPQIHTLKKLPTMEFPWSITRLKRFEVVHVPRVSELPKEAAAEKSTFIEQDIKSLILVPMVYGGVLIGFVGLDSVRQQRSWDDDAIALLRIVGEMLVSALVRSRTETELRAAHDQLLADRKALEDKNIAMREVLASFEDEKQKTRDQIATNVEESLLPLLDRVKEQSSDPQRKLVELLEQYLKDIASPFIDRLRRDFARLTPRELEICNMIKAGRPSKEIAQILNVSLLTVHKHREQIRNKLGLKNSNKNLNTFLQAL
jgi:PAS domain S-box-containing protein